MIPITALRRRAPLLLAFALVSGCAARPAGSPSIHVEGAWARPAAAGAASAAYFTVVNDGAAPDTLIGVAADVAAHADLHQSRTEGEIARMLPVARLVVPARGRVAFQPGGYHVMLMGLIRDLKPGDQVRLVLHFATSGDRLVDARVGEGESR
jgi:copper(I)-binding protein